MRRGLLNASRFASGPQYLAVLPPLPCLPTVARWQHGSAPLRLIMLDCISMMVRGAVTENGFFHII